MNPNLLGVFSALLALVAFAMAHRYGVAKPGMRRKATLVACLMAVPGASFAAYYTHCLPDAAWYFQFRSLPGTELLVVFVGVAGGLVASMLPRVLLVLPLVVSAGLSTSPFLKPFVGPIPDFLWNNQWADGVCLQSTPSTCGPASAASILKTLGVDVTEAELAAEAHSYMGGTEAWYLARAIRERGFDVRFRQTRQFDPEGTLPAIAGVRLAIAGHFIPILGKDGEKFVTGDPLGGKVVLSRDELNRRYAFTGFTMEISRKKSRLSE